MLDKFIKEVVGIVVGHQIERINTVLKKDKYTNEFLIAKKLDIAVNHTRTFLYKLLEFGLVSSLKEKDEKKGFYIYSWKLNDLKCLEFLKSFLENNKKKLEKLKEEKSHKEIYKCKRCVREVSVEDALANDFYCMECGELLEINDNTKFIEGINRKIIALKSKLNLVKGEIEKLKKKISLEEEKDSERARGSASLGLSKSKGNIRLKIKKTPSKKEVTSKKKPVKKVVKKKAVKKKIVIKKPIKKKIGTKKPVKKVVRKGIVKKKIVIKKSPKKKVVKRKSAKKVVKKKEIKKRVSLFSNIFKK